MNSGHCTGVMKSCMEEEIYVTHVEGQLISKCLFGAQSPMSVVLTDRKRTAQILRAKTLRPGP